MTVKLLESGVIPAAGRPSTWGFWEAVRVGRFKVYIDYLYLETPKAEEVPTDVLAHVYTTDFRLVGTWMVGEVHTSLAIKEIRVRLSRRALQRLDEIKAALQWFILDGVQQHAENVA